MNQIVVDVTNIDGVKLDDMVILLGRQEDSNDMAEQLWTIEYEVISNISKRAQRYYV